MTNEFTAEGHRALLQAIDWWVDLKPQVNRFMPNFRESARATILARAAELTQVTAQSVERASPATQGKDGGEQDVGAFLSARPTRRDPLCRCKPAEYDHVGTCQKDAIICELCTNKAPSQQPLASAKDGGEQPEWRDSIAAVIAEMRDAIEITPGYNAQSRLREWSTRLNALWLNAQPLASSMRPQSAVQGVEPLDMRNLLESIQMTDNTATPNPLKVYKCTDCDWYVAESLEQAKELCEEAIGEPCEEGYPVELTDAELDKPTPEFGEDEAPTGNMTTIRQMLAEHIGGPGWFAGSDW